MSLSSHNLTRAGPSQRLGPRSVRASTKRPRAWGRWGCPSSTSGLTRRTLQGRRWARRARGRPGRPSRRTPAPCHETRCSGQVGLDRRQPILKIGAAEPMCGCPPEHYRDHNVACRGRVECAGGCAMHVLVADSLPEKAISELESRGHTCEVDPSLGEADLADRIHGFDILVVRSTKVTGTMLGAGDRLALVIRAGAGTNTIDTAAAASRGVLVANVPGRNSAAVAELTMGLLLAVDRRIPDNVADLRAGRWNKKTYSKATGLLGSTMGIVGL